VKHLDEFNDPELARRLLDEIARVSTRPAVLMEVCGGQTHSIIRHGIDQLLPPGLELLHGPGCPVCVTPLETIDRALAIAALTDVMFCSFGDMLRVPGSTHDLLTVKSRGGDVRVVYSPLDAVRLAERHPERQVVFFAVGFETTAPALEAILQAPTCRVQGFLAAGHVCAVMGVDQYRAVCDRYRVPIVITGFEPLDLLDGIRRAVVQLETGRAQVENAYTRVVRDEGNPVARALLARVFEVCDRTWRGIGLIPDSGWRLRPDFRAFDAEARFDVGRIHAVESPLCHSGEVLQGLIAPTGCPAFGRECTPRTPLGATMVSDEGTCAAYFTHRRVAVGGD